MSTGKKIKFAFWVVLAVIIAGFLCYNLPRTDVVQVTGTDTKYTGKSGSGKISTDSTGKGGGGKIQIQAVRYINTISRKGKIRVFRNEDTGWGWPPYLKFNSADVTAQNRTETVGPGRYYGWRINMFSMFPNAISLRTVDKAYSHLPLFNIVFLVALAGITIFVVIRFRRFKRRLRERFGKKSSEPSAKGSS